MTLFGNSVSVDDIVKMRSLGWALIQYDWCPYLKKKKEKKGSLYTDRPEGRQCEDTQRESHVMMEAEVGLMRLQGQECRGLLATIRS